MLVTFRTDAHAGITMYGDIAKQMLKMMGHSGTIPGAILAEDVPAALQKLSSAMEAVNEPTIETGKNTWDNQRVSMHSRATPLIELLEAAAAEQCNVMWEEARMTEPGISF